MSAVSGNPSFWQDRDIKFDVTKQQMEPTKGEITFCSQANIEDAKGNEGETGTMITTNMRLIWYQSNDPKINLSIGLKTVNNVEIKNTYSEQTGNSQKLHIKAKYKTSRFEFIFKSIMGDQPRVFLSFKNVFASFEKAILFREMKTNGGDILQDGDLLVQNGEKIVSRYNNILTVGSDQSAKGVLYFTNVRIVWFSLNNQQLNVSIPWIQIKQVNKRNLKQGPALVIETYGDACGYIAKEGLEEIVKECQKLHNWHQSNPVYGVSSEGMKETKVSKTPDFVDEEIQFVDSVYNDRANVSRSYQTTQETASSGSVVYAPRFGLAVEQPQEGATLEDLWRILKINK